MKYYKTTDEKVLSARRTWVKSRCAYIDAALALSEEIGASKTHFYRNRRSGTVAAFVFEEGKTVPDHFCRYANTSDGWRPRLNVKPGKDLDNRIRHLPCVFDGTIFNHTIGYHATLVPGGRMLEWPTNIEHDGAVWFEIPDDVEYTPPAHVLEVLGSEYLRANEQEAE